MRALGALPTRTEVLGVAFCALLARHNHACAACLECQSSVRRGALTGAATLLGHFAWPEREPFADVGDEAQRQTLAGAGLDEELAAARRERDAGDDKKRWGWPPPALHRDEGGRHEEEAAHQRRRPAE